MLRGDTIILRNLNRHIDPCRDGDVRIYAYRGNLYYKVGDGEAHLIGGQTVINNYVASQGGGGTDDVRSGRQVLLTAGAHSIVFTDPLGVSSTGEDYNLFFDVYDMDGAVPSYTITDRTKYGFSVVTYDDNIKFGWKAELVTQ